METLTIPANTSEITADWLTAALGSRGHLGGAKVVGFECEVIGEGVGFVGELSRISLEYDREAPSAPKSLIAKLPTSFELSRQIAVQFQFYARENRFYEEIAPLISLRVPKAYYSAGDPAAANFVLLLEDLSQSMKVGDQLAGIDIARAQMIIRALGRFHAEWWDDPRLEAMDWLPRVNDPIQRAAEVLYQMAWPTFVEKFKDRLTPYQFAAAEQLGSKICAIMDHYAGRPLMIAHVDFRLDNMLFGEPGAADEYAVIDWQLCVRGGGMFDLAYFLSQSLEPDQRRKHEHDLVRLYHDQLVAGGVKDYGFEQCWEDYRLSTLLALLIPVNASANLDTSTERGLRLMEALVMRSVTAIEDLQSAELLP